MRVHHLKIDNFRGLQNFEVSFCDELGAPRALTVLVGPNMSGKTTVLDAIHLVYACLENATHPKLRPDLQPDDPALRSDANLPISITIRFSLHDDEWEALDDLEHVLGHPGVDVTKTETYELEFQWPPPKKSHFGVVRSSPPKSNLAFRGRATAKVAKSRRLVDEGIFDKIGGVLYLDQHRSVNLQVPSTATAPEEQLRELAGSRDVLPWLELVSRLHEKWDPVIRGESTWSRVKRLYAALAVPSQIDDIKAFDEGFDLRFHRGNQYYYSAGLSMGERQVLRLVTNLAAFRANRSVILMDEAELHLHPRWQRNLVHFARSGGDDDNQFILTTHSESLLRYVDPADVLTLGPLDGA